MQHALLGPGTVPGTGPHGHLFVPDCLPTGFLVGPHLQACPIPWDELDHFPAPPLVLVANADQRQSGFCWSPYIMLRWDYAHPCLPDAGIP